MDKLTDEYLTLYLEQMESLRKRNLVEWMHEKPWLLALQEIRERRASDLTDFDRTVLAVLRDRIADDPLGDRAMIAALDKILENK